MHPYYSPLTIWGFFLCKRFNRSYQMSEGDGRLFKAHLPNTGEQDHLGQIFTATSLGIIAGLGLMVKDKKEDLS
ncbi:TPA: LPXTG cell wall anchor domain-containing protein [Streptococcus suis]